MVRLTNVVLALLALLAFIHSTLAASVPTSDPQISSRRGGAQLADMLICDHAGNSHRAVIVTLTDGRMFFPVSVGDHGSANTYLNCYSSGSAKPILNTYIPHVGTGGCPDASSQCSRRGTSCSCRSSVQQCQRFRDLIDLYNACPRASGRMLITA